jgi:hypothetical protein
MITYTKSFGKKAREYQLLNLATSDRRKSMKLNKTIVIVGVISVLAAAVAFPLSRQAHQQQYKQIGLTIPASQQKLVDTQGQEVKGLDIDLRQPRLLTEGRNIEFDANDGIRHANSFFGFKGSISSAVLEVPFPLNSVTLTWYGQNGVSDSAFVIGYLRTSSNLSDWSVWTKVEPTNAEFIYPDLFESEHLPVPPDTRYVQFKIEFLGGSADITPSLNRIRLNYFMAVSPTDPIQDNNIAPPQLQDQTSVEQQTAAVMQAVSIPRIISRVEWGCPDGENAPLNPPVPNHQDNVPVTHLVVHHTLLGTMPPPPNANNYKAWVKKIWQEHHDKIVDGAKQGDIGYNILIDPDGNVYEGRAGGVDEKGFHFACHNSHTTGIALLGDFSTRAPTTQALNALKQVLAWRAQSWGIDPRTHSILETPASDYPVRDVYHVAGHRDINPVTWSCHGDNDLRTCPGDALYGLLPGIRSSVAQMVPGFSMETGTVTVFLTQGSQGSLRLTLDSYGSLQGNVAFSASGLPQGVSFAPATVYIPANGTITPTLTLTSPLSVPTGNFSLTITAALGGIRRSIQTTLTVLPAPGSVTVKAVYNSQPWTGAVDYSVIGPNGVIIGLAVPSTTSNLPAGQYRLSYNRGGPAPLINVTPASTQTLSSGGQVTYTLNFSLPTPIPLAVTCSASPSTISTGQSSTFTASVSGGTSPYQYTWGGSVSGNTASVSKTFGTAGTFQGTVTVTDSSSPKQTKQSSCSVQVSAIVPKTFDFYTFSSSRTIQAGQNTSFDLYLQPQNGFSGQVNFSLAGLPSGASMTSNSQINISGTGVNNYALAIQTGTMTPAGTFLLTITATGQGVTRTVNLSLIITAPPPQPLSSSCSISPNPITLGQGATIYAQASGGTPPYRYRINGVDMGAASSLLVIPSQVGTFSTSTTITDSQNRQASSSCSAQVIVGNPYVTGFNYTPNPARASQVVSLNIYGGNFAAGITQVWFVGPGCSAPGCQTNAVNVGSAAYIAAQAVLNTIGTYTVNIRNGAGSWVQVGTVTVVR